jgi:DTW domain-containing protein YfiP
VSTKSKAGKDERAGVDRDARSSIATLRHCACCHFSFTNCLCNWQFADAAKPQLKKIELSLPGARAMSVSALTAIIVLTVAGAQAQDKLDLKYEVFVPMG